MLNSYEILWVTVIYNKFILFNKMKKEREMRNSINTATERIVDWILYNEYTRLEERAVTGLTNWEFKL